MHLILEKTANEAPATVLPFLLWPLAVTLVGLAVLFGSLAVHRAGTDYGRKDREPCGVQFAAAVAFGIAAIFAFGWATYWQTQL